MVANISALCISPDSSIHDAIECIDRHSEQGIALVVDAERRLVGTVTDGDIRRAILAGISMDLPVQQLLENREPTAHPTPVTASVGTPHSHLLGMMNEHVLRHIPLVDDTGRVVDVALLNELAKDKEYDLPLSAVVMVGGYGSRLQPLTEALPKPMLPVGDRPLLERIIEQLRQAGIRKVNLTTLYKKEIISEHFGDGQDFGVEIQYVKEKQPLGTAGALALLNDSNEPLLVINGDILTRIDFRAMMQFHREHRAEMTVAVRQYEFRVPYGVIETDGARIVGISEKPIIRHFINAGIYLLNPGVHKLVPRGKRYDMTDLIGRLLTDGRQVVSFPIREYWLDIGQYADYQKAEDDLRAGKV